jgi:hypothetical protein
MKRVCLWIAFKSAEKVSGFLGNIAEKSGKLFPPLTAEPERKRGKNFR